MDQCTCVSVKWNPDNAVLQCHRCGRVIHLCYWCKVRAARLDGHKYPRPEENDGHTKKPA